VGGEGFLALTWREIELLSLEIAERVSSTQRVDAIIAILRGGWLPASLIADYMGIKKLGAIEVKFYKAIGETAEKPVVVQPLTMSIRGLRILVVDDVSDTGKTLATTVSFLNHYGPQEVKTATLFLKPWSTFKPDYYARETASWIIFPWDKAETASELLARGMSIEEVAKLIREDTSILERILRARGTHGNRNSAQA